MLAVRCPSFPATVAISLSSNKTLVKGVASRDQPAQWFIEGQTAWQFTPGSAVELAYLLTRAADQPQHVQETTATAATYFDTHHSIGALLARLAALYRSIIDEGRAVSTAATEHSSGDKHP